MGYTRYDDRIWDDEKFQALSTMARLLWKWLIGNPTSNFIGIYILRPSVAMEHIGRDVKPKEFEDCLSEIVRLGMVLYDPTTRVVLIKNKLRYTPIGGDKSLKGVLNHLRKLPRTRLLYEFRDIIEQPHIRGEGRNEDIVEAVNRFLETMNMDGLSVPPARNKDDEEEPPQPDTLNVDGLVGVWNQVCAPVFPAVKGLPPRRKSTIRARLKEVPNLDVWRGIFQRIAESPFLRGENDRGWRADIDWVLNPNNLAKILEGKYDDRKNVNRPKTGMDALRAMAEEESLPRNQLGEADDDQGYLSQGNGPADEVF